MRAYSPFYNTAGLSGLNSRRRAIYERMEISARIPNRIDRPGLSLWDIARKTVPLHRVSSLVSRNDTFDVNYAFSYFFFFFGGGHRHFYDLTWFQIKILLFTSIFFQRHHQRVNYCNLFKTVANGICILANWFICGWNVFQIEFISHTKNYYGDKFYKIREKKK